MWPPSKRTLVFFFSYWILLCVAFVFTGCADRLGNWMANLPVLLSWVIHVGLWGGIAISLWIAARFSATKFR